MNVLREWDEPRQVLVTVSHFERRTTALGERMAALTIDGLAILTDGI